MVKRVPRFCCASGTHASRSDHEHLGHVRIGEPGNLAGLTGEQWNELVRLIESRQLGAGRGGLSGPGQNSAQRVV
jgi:hypothetical protein